MKVYNLYGLSAGTDERWREELLLSEKTMKDIEFVIPIAEKDGFHDFRIAEIDLNAVPDFVGTIKGIQ